MESRPFFINTRTTDTPEKTSTSKVVQGDCIITNKNSMANELT